MFAAVDLLKDQHHRSGKNIRNGKKGQSVYSETDDDRQHQNHQRQFFPVAPDRHQPFAGMDIGDGAGHKQTEDRRICRQYPCHQFQILLRKTAVGVEKEDRHADRCRGSGGGETGEIIGTFGLQSGIDVVGG